MERECIELWRRRKKLFIYFVATKFLSLRRTLVRRNNRNFERLVYEVFYLSICDFTSLLTLVFEQSGSVIEEIEDYENE
jgi:hypothetical protein